MTALAVPALGLLATRLAVAMGATPMAILRGMAWDRALLQPGQLDPDRLLPEVLR